MVKKRRVFDLFVVLVSLVCFHQASCGGPLPIPTPEAEQPTSTPEGLCSESIFIVGARLHLTH